MPISDLLASITGEKPAASPTTLTRPSTAAPKRKAEDELRGPTRKTPRAEPAANGSSRPNGTSSKPISRPTDRPSSTTTTSKPSTNASNSSTRPATSVSRAPITASSKPTARPAVTSSAKSIPSRPAANGSATGDVAPKPAATKKGSFAEIMARAKANAAVRESFGKIQHKTTEKGLTMKERKELKAEEARQLKKGARPTQLAGRNGTASLASRPGASNASHRAPPPSKPGSKPSTATAKGKSTTGSGGEEKKVKKAALATTGYTGTARPRPGAKPSQSGSSLSSQRSGGSRLGSGYGGGLSARKRRDDYDDELDDFIEYDDEEDDPYGARPRYDSYDDESDMEAGLTDIDEEERRAEMIARKEDLEQEALELKMKQEKERKKLLASRGGR